MKIISIILKSEFGFFKKPDTNGSIYTTFNFIHKPAILGILGAVIGLSGYSEKDKYPEYFEKLKNFKIGVKPIIYKNAAFSKTVIKYNNSVGYASQESGGNLIIEEQTIINPQYKIFIAENNNAEFEKIYENLKNQTAIYLPYMGKNDFSLWWESFQEYNSSDFDFSSDYQIDSIFIKEKIVKDNIAQENNFDIFKLLNTLQNKNNSTFIIFERLPIGFNDELKHYEYQEFVYTNSTFNNQYKINNLYKINGKIIQLF